MRHPWYLLWAISQVCEIICRPTILIWNSLVHYCLISVRWHAHLLTAIITGTKLTKMSPIRWLSSLSNPCSISYTDVISCSSGSYHIAQLSYDIVNIIYDNGQVKMLVMCSSLYLFYLFHMQFFQLVILVFCLQYHHLRIFHLYLDMRKIRIL